MSLCSTWTHQSRQLLHLSLLTAPPSPSHYATAPLPRLSLKPQHVPQGLAPVICVLPTRRKLDNVKNSHARPVSPTHNKSVLHPTHRPLKPHKPKHTQTACPVQISSPRPPHSMSSSDLNASGHCMYIPIHTVRMDGTCTAQPWRLMLTMRRRRLLH